MKITVRAASSANESRLKAEINGALALAPDSPGAESESEIVFIDATIPELDHELEKLDRESKNGKGGRAVFLVLPKDGPIPDALATGKVDDVLVEPIRKLEVLSKLRWAEISRLNFSFSEALSRLQEDVALAERLQKQKLPLRFPEVRGFKVASRYLAGMKSGGDHFDLADAKEGGTLSMMLSDSSSYGLCSAVLSALMRVAVKLSGSEIRSSVDTVVRIQDELVATLSEKDRLSFFYGVVSRKDFKLRYVNLGTSSLFYADAGKSFRQLPSHGAHISRSTQISPSLAEAELLLEPEARLAVISDGFVDAAGGASGTLSLLNRLRAKDAADSLNEMVFQVKSQFSEPDDMPAQDCTAVIFDVDSRVIRLARS